MGALPLHLIHRIKNSVIYSLPRHSDGDRKKDKMAKRKTHLTVSQRCRIEFGLAAGESLRTIAKEIDVHPSTISREIEKHSCTSTKGCYGRMNQCIHRQDCKLSNLCGTHCPGSGAPCSRCSIHNCNTICSNVKFIGCEKRDARTAKVCNGCQNEKSCHKLKKFYIAHKAHEDYLKVLSEHRQGAALEDWELKHLDELVSPKIKDGQSIHHICVTSAAELTRNERTIQRYVNQGILSAKRGDLKRACMVRPRKSLAKAYQHKVETGCYVKRTYQNYEKFLSDNPGIRSVYMDLVIGRPGGVCLLTLHWVTAGFMIGVLIPNKCAASVTAVFDRLYTELGYELFAKLFPVILTDRGTEFSNPSRIEFTEGGERRTYVFFCDPMNSNQKSQLERNHELVREILPKGVSFDNLTQNQVSLALSHVNAYVRLSQCNRTPFEVFEFLYGNGTAEKLHISKIDPKEVILKPQLVGIEVK